jgi:hypothetical protein
MSNIETVNPEEESNKKNEPALLVSKVQHILKDLEILALEKGSRGSFDISKFTPQQIEKLLEILKTNEDNAFKFHTKRLETIEKIQIKKLDSSTINQKTVRIGLIGVIVAIPILTILILFFKDTFFIPWLTFLTGISSGVGLSKASKYLVKEPQLSNPIPDDNNEK